MPTDAGAARREGVVIVLQREQRFLVGQRAAHKPAAGYWTQISGKVEPGESQEQTVVREAMEEIGCVVRPLEKLQELPSANGKYLLHYWRAEIVEGEPAICDDEIEDLRWLTLAELLLLSPIFQEDVDLFERLSGETGRYG
jgi:8-oxo-dGTP pyrophosphatase MutT (NUDIX family)